MSGSGSGSAGVGLMSVGSMTVTDRRNIFDRIALGCISYLEHCEDCSTVTFQSNDGAPSHEFLIWDKKHSPFNLPEDLRRFYSIMNGFSMAWTVEVAERSLVIGDMRLNKIENITKCVVDPNLTTAIALSTEAATPLNVADCSLFILDNSCELGDIVLLYRHSDITSVSSTTATTAAPTTKVNAMPEVWLLSASGTLTYLCQSFTQYLRLMVVHLGVIGWQGAFTSAGLSEVTQHWMGLFCPERLLVDKQYRADVEKNSISSINNTNNVASS